MRRAERDNVSEKKAVHQYDSFEHRYEELCKALKVLQSSLPYFDGPADLVLLDAEDYLQALDGGGILVHRS